MLHQSDVENSAEYVIQLNLFSKKLYEELAMEEGFDFSLERKGILMYKSQQKWKKKKKMLLERAKPMGLDVVSLSQQEVQALAMEWVLQTAQRLFMILPGHLSRGKCFDKIQ